MYPPFRVSTLFVTFHDLGSHGAYGLKNVKILQLVFNPPGIKPSFQIPRRFRLEVMWKQTGIATTVLGANGCESSVDFSSTSLFPRTSPCPVGALTATGYRISPSAGMSVAVDTPLHRQVGLFRSMSGKIPNASTCSRTRRPYLAQ